MSTRSHFLPGATALLSLVLFAVSANIVFASLVRMSATFGVSAQVMATVSSVQFTGFFAASLIGGMLADAIGKKRVLQGGCLLVTLGAAVWSVAPSAAVAFAGGLVMGMGGGVLEAMSSALLTDLYPTRRKLVINLSQVAYCAGAVSGPALMGRLLPMGVSWRWFFGATAVCAAFLVVLYELSSVPRPVRQTASAEPVTSRGRSSLLLALTLPCSVIFLYVFAEMGTATFMTVYLHEVLAAPERWAIYSLSIFWAMMIIGRLLCALLPEHHGHERAIAFLMVAAAVAAVLQLRVSTWQSSILLFGLSGLTFAGTWPLIVSMVATRHASRSGTAVGVTVAFGSAGCIVAPAVISPLFAKGYAGAMFAVAACALAVGAGLVLLCPVLHRKLYCTEEATCHETV
jgi:MFS family permease